MYSPPRRNPFSLPPSKRLKSDRLDQCSALVPSNIEMGELTTAAHTRSQGPPPSYSEIGDASHPPHHDLAKNGT